MDGLVEEKESKPNHLAKHTYQLLPLYFYCIPAKQIIYSINQVIFVEM
jgi:hypothetical protein